MPKLTVGDCSLEISNGENLFAALKVLRDDSELAKKCGVNPSDAIAAEVNGVMKDLSTTITTDAIVTFFGSGSEVGLDILRHSAAHIMAQAVYRVKGGKVKYGIGPTIKDGFYYDMDADISESDLKAIEAEMKKIVKEDIPFEREEMSREEAIKLFKEADQPYKVELLEEMENKTVSVYRQGEFMDLCRGPHLPKTRYLKAFKLLSVAGAYWRGSEKNKMLNRIYATAFASKEDLANYLHILEEAKKRDHKKLGKELKLFSFHEEAPGMPFWLPKGKLMKNMLIDFMRRKIEKLGYVEIETPLILKEELWEKSGHKAKYAENMFFTQTKEEEFMAIKPMSCPGGMLVYKEEKHSYRELPLKVAEFGHVHRYEKSGQLNGLIRVRGFVQDDAHVFMMPEQIQDQILEIIRLVEEVYSAFDLDFKMELSTRPEMSIGSDEQWETATEGLRKALEAFGKDFKINEGDGAFYGPKIDFHVADALGRTHQCGTIQLDMSLPERFDMNYTGSDGEEHRVVMVHRAIYGSIDRFLGILVEHYAGKFPTWIAPVQAMILPVSDKFEAYANEVLSVLKRMGIRAEADFSNEKLGKKIREATLSKVPYMLIVGENEAEKNTVSVRSRDEGELGEMKWEDFLERILEENKISR